ncbi:MAG TPA: IclR family transcriptional regulator [Burkholderiaceae bacterium]|nr:IclR family transcriptional regulator [Burkholderiaceae bacterium]
MLVRTVDRALAMFEVFADRGTPMTLSELSRELDIPTSTCFGLMRTLQARGYLYEVGGRKTYYPTPRWLVKARRIESNDPVQETMRPFLQKLRDVTGETVVLSKRMSDCLVYLGVVESQHAVRYTAAVGDLKPMWSTSSGKALLGAVPAAEREPLIARLRAASGARLTAAQRQQLADEIQRGLKRGWFVGKGENVIDVMGVAAPVSVAGDVLSIAIAGPLVRMEPRIHAHAKQLVWTCKSILK